MRLEQRTLLLPGQVPQPERTRIAVQALRHKPLRAVPNARTGLLSTVVVPAGVVPLDAAVAVPADTVS